MTGPRINGVYNLASQFAKIMGIGARDGTDGT